MAQCWLTGEIPCGRSRRIGSNDLHRNITEAVKNPRATSFSTFATDSNTNSAHRHHSSKSIGMSKVLAPRLSQSRTGLAELQATPLQPNTLPREIAAMKAAGPRN